MSLAAAPQREIRVLLVEDVPVSAEIAKQALAEDGAPRFLHAHATSLAEARILLRKEDFEVVLLDLGLPDSTGLETLDAVRMLAPEIAVIVLTGLEFDDMALAALRRGADDYLYKGEFDREVLVRSVRHSIERRRMLNELERSRQRRNLARALRGLTRISALRSTPVREEGAVAREEPALRESDPDAFAKLALRYGDLARDCVAESIDVTTRAETLADLASILADRDAEPADLVDLHTVALTRRLAGLDASEAERYVASGRRLVLDLMGLLATRYAARG